MDTIQRYKNQRIAQFIHRNKRESSDNPFRIENCYRLLADRTHEVSIHKKPGSEKAHYHGLQTCGSVWACPICSSTISERRKREFQENIDTWRLKDPCNVVLMVTYTTPHYIFQSLDDVLSLQDKAIRIMKKQPQRKAYTVWRTCMDSILSIGSYTGREVTFGQNGWHPHRHECHFSVRATPTELVTLRENLTRAFAIAYEKAGGVITNPEAFNERAITVCQVTDDDGFDRISSYVTKVEGDSWTLAAEATKGIAKTAKNGNITPFGMLEHIRQGGPNANFYIKKYQEYAETMHGKRQFFPTHGLNAFLGTIHLTDKEIMKENEIIASHFANITNPQWRIILNRGLRAEVLLLAENRNEFEFYDAFSLFLLESELSKAG